MPTACYLCLQSTCQQTPVSLPSDCWGRYRYSSGLPRVRPDRDPWALSLERNWVRLLHPISSVFPSSPGDVAAPPMLTPSSTADRAAPRTGRIEEVGLGFVGLPLHPYCHVVGTQKIDDAGGGLNDPHDCRKKRRRCATTRGQRGAFCTHTAGSRTRMVPLSVTCNLGLKSNGLRAQRRRPPMPVFVTGRRIMIPKASTGARSRPRLHSFLPSYDSLSSFSSEPLNAGQWLESERCGTGDPVRNESRVDSRTGAVRTA